MQLTSRTTTFAALSAAALFFATAPAPAQGLVSIGSGSYVSPANAPVISSFSYFLIDQGNGAANGYAVWNFPLATFVVRVTSFGFFELRPGTTSLAFAGPIVAVLGTPAGGATVGQTAFSAFNDNGGLAADESAGFSVVPPLSSLPPLPPELGDLTTIQQIVALGQLLRLPPPRFAARVQGDVWIR